jgi:hypothetical protein
MKKKNLLFTAIAIFGLATITLAQVPSYVSANGLVGWWPFNGNANDESGNNNNGTVNGATLTADRFGNANKAYSFDGMNNRIEVAHNSNLNLSSVSISCWINPSALLTTTGYGPTILSKREASGWGASCQMNIGNHAFWADWTITSNSGIYHTDNTNLLININTLAHVVYTHDASLVRLYLNGTLVEEINSPGLLSFNTLPLWFGARPLAGGNSSFFNGVIDDIGIWNRALTACEISDLFSAQLNSSASIQAGTDVSICEGNDVIFNGSGGSNYTWNNGVQNGVAYIPTISQEYIVIGQDANNCYGTDTIYVELIPNTAATQTETALDSYTWPINSQTYTQSGTYTTVIPNAAGCDSTITLDLSLDFTGLEDNSQSALFSVFPNPAQSLINIKVDSKLIGSVYTIYDNTGRAVLTGKINSKDTTIELNNLSGGIYMFSVGENMKQTFKVIKE